MDIFWKVIAGVLIAVVLGLSLERGLGTLLSIAVCSMGIAAALEFARPVMSLLQQMETFSGIPVEFGKILFKVLGIGLTTEIAGMICIDAGNNAMAQMVRILAQLVILWISIPLFESILSLIRHILGGI